LNNESVPLFFQRRGGVKGAYYYRVEVGVFVEKRKYYD